MGYRGVFSKTFLFFGAVLTILTLQLDYHGIGTDGEFSSGINIAYIYKSVDLATFITFRYSNDVTTGEGRHNLVFIYIPVYKNNN